MPHPTQIFRLDKAWWIPQGSVASCFYPDGQQELYDRLSSEIETENIAFNHTDIAAELQRQQIYRVSQNGFRDLTEQFDLENQSENYL